MELTLIYLAASLIVFFGPKDKPYHLSHPPTEFDLEMEEMMKPVPPHVYSVPVTDSILSTDYVKPKPKTREDNGTADKITVR